MTDVDAVVIGAGNAGLTAAVSLQRAGLRTLLVERHNVPGGCATSFRRGRFEFEVALHQLSGLGTPDHPGSVREVLDTLGVGDRLEFVREHDLYRSLVPDSHDVTIPADRAAAIEALDSAFPGNRDRLERFFDLVWQVAQAQVELLSGTPVDRVDPALFAQALRSTQDVLDEHFTDPGLKNAVGIYWSYLGQPPARLPFQNLASLLHGYFEDKPWHIRGGSQALSTALLDAFVAAGGDVRFHTAVTAIHTERGRVVGVGLDDGQQVSTRHVVSNASLPTTYGMLGEVPAVARADLASRRIGVSAFVLHMGLAATPAELGFTASTNFVTLDNDAERTLASWRSLEAARGVCVSCYDIEPIGFSPPGASHISLLTLQYADVWDKIAPADYHAAKFAYAETLLDVVEHLTPGIRDVIEEVDVATPRTMARYLGHPGGAIYGYDQDATEGWLFRDERRSHVEGLYPAGAWTGMGGFGPTLESGMRAADRALRSMAA